MVLSSFLARSLMKVDKLALGGFDRKDRSQDQRFHRPCVWNEDESRLPCGEAICKLADRKITARFLQAPFMTAIVIEQRIIMAESCASES